MQRFTHDTAPQASAIDPPVGQYSHVPTHGGVSVAHVSFSERTPPSSAQRVAFASTQPEVGTQQARSHLGCEGESPNVQTPVSGTHTGSVHSS